MDQAEQKASIAALHQFLLQRLQDAQIEHVWASS